MNSNRFAILSEQNEITEEENSFAVLTEENLRLVQEYASEPKIFSKIVPKIVIDARFHLLKALVSALVYNIRKKDFCSVYRTGSIFEHLEGLPIYRYIHKVAEKKDGSYRGDGVKLFQYKYKKRIINIVIEYSWGSCSYCDRDIALEESLCYADTNEIKLRLVHDLKMKFNSCVFFLDIKEATSYIRNNCYCYDKLLFL
jgi:hypothetical protein